MKKETGLPKLVAHKFITIFYLPITIAFYLYVAIGNIYDIGRLSFSSLEGYIDAFILMFPFVTVVLFTVALVGLLGLTHFGRRAILFSTTFRIAMMLFIIFGEMTYGKMTAAAVYAAICVVNILIYAYYRRRELYFVVDGQSLSEAYVMQKKSRMPAPVRKTAPVASSEVKEEEAAPAAEEDKEVPAEEEKEAPAAEENNVEEEEFTVTVSDADRDYSSFDVKKKCQFIFTPDKNRSVNLLSATLTIFDRKTLATLEVENTSETVYSESDWLFMSDIAYTSKTPIGKGKTEIKAEINQPFDRISIVLKEVR